MSSKGNSDNKYFVYCFFDIRKSGKYTFNEFSFEFEPIYIGKGKGRRPLQHYFLCKNTNTRFYSKMKAIMNAGFRPEFIHGA
jgi:hypothetical protein